MRNTKHIIWAAALATLFAACSKEPETPSGTTTITAYMDETVFTKTSLENGECVRWSGSDKIALKGKDKVYESVGTLIKEDGRVAEFTVSAAAASASIALYPCDKSATFADNGVVTTNLQSKQTAVENGFASGLDVAIAKVNGTSEPLRFHNTGALVSVKVGNDGIKKLSLTPCGDTPMAGSVAIRLDGERPVCTPADTGKPSGVDLEGSFRKGKTYCFIILPGTYKGFSLTITNTIGQTITLSYPDTVTLESNDNLVLEDLPDLTRQFGEQEITAWDRFDKNMEGNLLPDFSYAGYDHGEKAPQESGTLGYSVYDITRFGAVADDGKSDRDALIYCLTAIFGNPSTDGNGDLVFPHKEQANAIIKFPAGEFILHAEGDRYESKTIYIRGGNLILSGAGREATTLTMAQKNQPRSSALYSSPVMIDFKHMSAPSAVGTVTANAAKGSFSVTVSSTAGLSEGTWICLKMNERSDNAISEELSPYSLDANWTEIAESGVTVTDYHQIRSINGKTVTFYEPLMHEVKAQYNWTINTYPHYSEVGIEDLTFKGYAKPDYAHHASWEDDGAFKPVNMTRIVNGWMRRVGFESVSEAASLIYCSNMSVYDVSINGNRGHSAIRSQESSRVFIGKVSDTSGDGLGQDHAVGVSKPAIGTVLWRNTWGTESCFEAHASQPRATLIDCCSGGWEQMHCGGDRTMLPNHLDDLVIWNFNAVNSFSGIWDWWTLEGLSWKFLPPVIVGFHGGDCTFNPDTVKYEESHGTAVNDPVHAPESLYEAQLTKRLGSLPAWLQELKNR
ncbi:MAG: DUF4955 domain-containing protein [Candidatus Cryptobacteroides sp.]